MMTFSEYMKSKAVEEGLLLPDKPIRPGVPRINTTALTNAQRRKLHPKPVKAPPPIAPFKATVTQVVPSSLIPKMTPARVSTAYR